MRAVLLIPGAEYREVLLQGGPCGSQPPTVTNCGVGGDGSPSWQPGLWSPDALVLVWGGVVVPEGVDRARRTISGVISLRRSYSAEDAKATAYRAEELQVGKVVVLE